MSFNHPIPVELTFFLFVKLITFRCLINQNGKSLNKTIIIFMTGKKTITFLTPKVKNLNQTLFIVQLVS